MAPNAEESDYTEEINAPDSPLIRDPPHEESYNSDVSEVSDVMEQRTTRRTSVYERRSKSSTRSPSSWKTGFTTAFKWGQYVIWLLWFGLFSFVAYLLKLEMTILQRAKAFFRHTLRQSKEENILYSSGKFLFITLLLVALLTALFSKDVNVDLRSVDHMISTRVESIVEERLQHHLYQEHLTRLQQGIDELKNSITELQNQDLEKTLLPALKKYEESIGTLQTQLKDYDKNFEKVSELDNNVRGVLKDLEDIKKKPRDHKVDPAFVQDLIDESLRVYSADRISKVDYANRHIGGKIVNYQLPQNASLQLESPLSSWIVNFFVSQDKLSDPNKALEAPLSAGQCWMFPGGQANLTIDLAASIIPTEFSVDHIDSTVALHIESAPKEFRIWGVRNQGDELLAEFSYQINTKYNVQTFEALPTKNAYQRVRIEILSNYGHTYTCLYRIRVHGNPSQ